LRKDEKHKILIQLAVDIGNSFAKAALFDGSNHLGFQYFDDKDPSALLPLFANFAPPTSCLIATVRAIDGALLDFLSSFCETRFLSSETALPFRIAYQTPQTLGPDRIAAVAAAYGKFPKKNVLVIDMGTCITYDLLTAQKVYQGGSISPGIAMRFKAMHQFTGKLPAVEAVDHAPLIGFNTTTAMQSGVMWGIQAEIDGIIDAYAHLYEDLTVLIGGGDNKYFDKKFRISIFASSNLVIEGLKIIMDYNEIG
jgi:type III pantothenate kinase